MGRDDGLDEERGEEVTREVQSWRRTGKLPYPRFTADRIDQLEGTLDYPPRRSVEIDLPEEEMQEAAEPLSTESDREGVDKLKDSSNDGVPKY